MTSPSGSPSDGQPTSPTRRRFLEHLVALAIRPSSHKYYLRWAEDWITARGNRSADATTAFFDALGRSSHLGGRQPLRGTERFWAQHSVARRARRGAEPTPAQFRLAVDAVRILARDILALPWAAGFDWQGLADQAWPLGPDHRALDQEAIEECAQLPAPPPVPSGPPPETDDEIDRIVEALRRAIRMAGFASATERAYVHWNIRFTRFCLTVLKQTPRDAGPPAITPFLDSLELERNVAPATRKQALKAVVFLTRKVFGLEDFTFEHVIAPAHGGRPSPPAMTCDEIRLVISHLDGPWKLAALLIYGSGLRVIECLRLRVRDLDFAQGTITVRDGRGNTRRVIPMPGALAPTLLTFLAGAHESHLRDLAGGAGEVHMPESLLRGHPEAAREWPWQYVFASATLWVHPRTRRVARHHLHQDSMARQFRAAALKGGISKRVSPNLLRHRFAARLLESGADIGTIQDLMGHASLASTIIYLFGVQRPSDGAPAPIDCALPNP